MKNLSELSYLNGKYEFENPINDKLKFLLK